ncbi:hypothetical protein BGZ52_000448 [Haplosporangium bisporale]|uniref:Coth protein-domain-containing protein n=1 Tax=Podila verticillata NRRL 6337 TaxID=1069443 RepID=A0A086TK09_9FUNG|nr:hypothetical protein BGZ52_000448 [Haplosporangium bisporale]KAF9209323.1 hypothetical protein BGZ59_010166 [Podila verticillata]KFH62286.1 hypothetical protein MVEG_11497 [Podila verticillata NRRL 6337]
MKRLFLSLAIFASTTLADVTYNVIGYPDTETGAFGVSINGQITKLTTSTLTFPLWTGIVAGATTASEYKYVKLDGAGAPVLEETFVRKFEDLTDAHTRNEFFERPVTKTRLPNVPLVYDPWAMSDSKAFDDEQIATFHLTTDAGQFDAMLQAPMEAHPIKANVRYINAKVVHNVDNVTLGLSGKSSMEFNKMAFKLEFDTAYNQSFFSRPSIKLRSESSDPTLIREKLYIDMLNVMGVPTQQGAWVRLYVNSKPQGLYLMVDDISKSFLKQTVHNGQILERGSLWQMNAPVVEDQADLRYLGPAATDYPKDVYKMKNLGANPAEAPMTQLLQFMKDLADFNVDSTSAINYWNARLDLDGFLRNMAMEYLAGSWDAYWYSGSNYFIYFNPTLGEGANKGRWQWISTDFDGTFGDGDPTDILTTYQAYANFDEHDRPMITKLILANKDINARFEQILRETVGWAFKPEGLFPRLEAYERMLAWDVAWDDSLNAKRANYPGKTNGWTEKDFHESIAGPVKNMNLGIKLWIEQRVAGLEAQLGFKVQPGASDRVKRPLHRPHGGKSDAEVNTSALSSAMALPMIQGVWAALAMGAVLAFF